MAAPNIVNLTSLYGKTAVQAVTTSATAIVTNSAASGKVLKVNALYAANIDGSFDTEISVDVYRSSTAYYVAKGITIPADATISILDTLIYLEEGDSLRLTAVADNKVTAVCSYEEIS